MMVESVGAGEQDRLNGPGKDLHVMERFTRVADNAAALPLHRGGSGHMGTAMDRRVHLAGNRSAHLRICVPRGQLRVGEHPAGRAAAGCRGRQRSSVRRRNADEIHAVRIRCCVRSGCCPGCGASRIRRRVRRQSSGAAQGPHRQSRMGKPAYLDPHGGEEAGRQHRSVDDRGRQPELAAASGNHARILSRSAPRSSSTAIRRATTRSSGQTAATSPILTGASCSSVPPVRARRVMAPIRRRSSRRADAMRGFSRAHCSPCSWRLAPSAWRWRSLPHRKPTQLRSRSSRTTTVVMPRGSAGLGARTRVRSTSRPRCPRRRQSHARTVDGGR